MLASIDWTNVIVVGVPSILSALFAGVAMMIAASNRRQLQTPSGDRIGAVAERTHDITHATGVLVQEGVTQLRKMNGHEAE
jgi:hypothetical protein